MPFLRFHCGCSKMKGDLSFILVIYAALINIPHCTIFMQPKFRSQCWHLCATTSSLFTWHQSKHINMLIHLHGNKNMLIHQAVNVHSILCDQYAYLIISPPTTHTPLTISMIDVRKTDWYFNQSNVHKFWWGLARLDYHSSTKLKLYNKNTQKLHSWESFSLKEKNGSMFLVEAKTETWLLKIIGYGGHSPQEGVFLSFKTHKNLFLSLDAQTYPLWIWELSDPSPTYQTKPWKDKPRKPFTHTCMHIIKLTYSI